MYLDIIGPVASANRSRANNFVCTAHGSSPPGPPSTPRADFASVADDDDEETTSGDSALASSSVVVDGERQDDVFTISGVQRAGRFHATADVLPTFYCNGQ